MQFRRLKFAAALCALTAATVAPGIAAHAELIVGLNTANQIFTFDSATPGANTALVTVTGITGSLLDIDFRPANSLLYGLGQSGNTLSLYTINTGTGAATLVNTFTNAITGTSYDIDFNPAANALRVVGNNGDNFRVPTAAIGTGSVAFTGDTAINGGTNILGVAYTNNFSGTPNTTLYDIGVSGGVAQLYRQGDVGGAPVSPNTGTLTAIGTGLGIGAPSELGFDISGLTNTAYVTSSTALFTVNLGTGTSNFAGSFGTGVGTVRGIAAPIGAAAPEPGTFALLGTGLVGMAGMIRRKSKKA